MSFFKSPFNWFNKFGTIPESYTEAMSYEEQIMWLCKEIKDNEGFIDEFKKEFQDVSTILQEMEQAINDNIYAITELQNTKQDTVVAGKGINITKYEFADHPEIATSPLDYNKYILNDCYIDIHNLEVGDTVNLVAISSENTSCIVINAKKGDVYDFLGNFDFVKTDESNVITTIEKGIEVTEWNDCFRFYVLHEGKIVISYWNTDSYEPQVRRFVDTEFLVEGIDSKQDKLIAGSGITITGNTISADSLGFAPFDITSYVTTGSYIDINQAQIGDTISLTPVSGSNTAYFIKEVVTNEKLDIAGKFDLVKIDSDNEVTFKYSAETTPDEPASYEALSTGRIVISFYDTNTNTVKLEQIINAPYVFENIDWNQQIRKISTDIYLADGTASTGLINGLYYTGSHKIYVNNVAKPEFDNALIMVNGSTIFIIASPSNNKNQYMYQEWYYDSGEWKFGFYTAYTDWSKVGGRPTINNLTANVNLIDGSSETGLSDGIYYADNYKVYVNGNEKSEYNKGLFLVKGSNLLLLGSLGINATSYLYSQWYYNESNEWTFGFVQPVTTWQQIWNKPAGIENYSTTEQVIGTWIDGKPLYRTTVFKDNLSASLSTNFSHSISDIGLVTKLDGMIYNSSVAFFPFGYKYSTYYTNVICDANDLTLDCELPTGYTYTAYINVYYTKTTD